MKIILSCLFCVFLFFLVPLHGGEWIRDQDFGFYIYFPLEQKVSKNDLGDEIKYHAQTPSQRVTSYCGIGGLRPAIYTVMAQKIDSKDSSALEKEAELATSQGEVIESEYRDVHGHPAYYYLKKIPGGFDHKEIQKGLIILVDDNLIHLRTQEAETKYKVGCLWFQKTTAHTKYFFDSFSPN